MAASTSHTESPMKTAFSASSPPASSAAWRMSGEGLLFSASEELVAALMDASASMIPRRTPSSCSEAEDARTTVRPSSAHRRTRSAAPANARRPGQ